MEENKTEALREVEEKTPAQPEAAAPASPEFSQETLQALAKAVAAYMQPEQQAPSAESKPAENPPAAAPQQGQNPPVERELTPEEKQAAEAAKQEELKRKRRKRRIRELRALAIKTALLLVVVYVLMFKIVGVTVMPNGDMYPRIDSGDLILYYRLDKDVKAQDIIVMTQNVDYLRQLMNERQGSGPDLSLARLPRTQRGLGALLHSIGVNLGIVLPDEEEIYISRVVAVEGDTVEITDDGYLLVNNNHMIESNIFFPGTVYTGFTEYPLTLGKGQCFVMADRRNGGADSRFFGPVDEDQILGTVITIVRRNNL